MTASSELPLLATMARYNGMSIIAVDSDARVTKVVGDIKHELTCEPQSAIGKHVDSLFVNDPGFSQCFHNALKNRPAKITICTKAGGYSEIQVVPLLDEHGNIGGAFAFETDVTKREEDEETLKEYRDSLKSTIEIQARDLDHSESRMRSILNGGSVPVILADPDGKIQFVNAAFLALTGYSEQEMFVASPWTKIYDEQTLADPNFLHDRAALYSGSIDQCRRDVRIRTKNGELRWVDFTASMARDSEGNRIQIIFILLDITERYQMTQAASEASELARLMFEKAPMPCSILNKDLKVIDCNQEALKLFNIPNKQVYRERFMDLFPKYQPDGRVSLESVPEKFTEAFETGYSRFEWLLQELDSTIPIPLEVTFVRLKWENGYVVAAYGRDLREERRMLAEMREADERTQLMLDSTPQGCTLFDEHCNVIDCNLAALHLLGVSSKIKFCEWFYKLSPEYQPDGSLSKEKIQKYIEIARNEGFSRTEWMHQKLDGTQIPTEVTLVRIKRGDKYIFAGYARDLREHKRILAEMREADERSKIMLDATPLCCNFWDEQFQIVDCNMEAVKLFGLKDKQEYLDRFLDLSPEQQPDGRLSIEKFAENIVAAFRDGYCRFEWIHQTLYGTPIPAEITLVCVQRRNGYIVLGYTRDLREEKKMLAEMREADDRTRLMLDVTPLGCAIFGKNAQIIDCNLEVVRLFGVPSKEEFKKLLPKLMPKRQPDGRLSMKVVYENVAAVFKTGYQRFEWMCQKLDGTPIPVEITVVRVKQERQYTAVVYARDLREIKKHEAIQERNRQRTAALLEMAQMAQQPELEVIDYAIKSVASLTDSTMGYIVLLEHTSNVLPFRSLIFDQLVSCALPTMTGEGTPHTLSPALTACLATKKAVIHNDFSSLPGPRTFPEGHMPVNSHMNVPILDGEKPIGIIGVGNKETHYTEADIMQLTLLAQGLGNVLNRKKYAENLEKAKFEAEAANKAKSEFLAHMSHEIRTPLNGVIGLSDLLAGTLLNDKQSEYVQLISESGNSLLFLINDILDFSKIEAGKLDIDHESFDLAATIGSVLASLVSRASAKKLELAVSICQNLPRVVQGDAGRVRQILLNLVGNAVKFTEHGGVRIDVTTESVDETSLTLKFSIIDTGIGISESGTDRLFKAFSQVDSSSARVYGGTGLGLAISMKLVKLMKGDIGVESVKGQGSTFWFKIPFECDPQTLQCLQVEKCPETKGPNCPNAEGQFCTAFVNREIDSEYSTKGRSILVVDDNEIQREALRIQLENWEMECVTCSSGKEALRLAAERRERGKPFELFIVDNTLFEESGTDLVRQLFDDEYKSAGTNVAQVVLLRSILEDFDQSVPNEARTETIAKPVLASTLFNAVMNRIFATERQKKIDSGIIDPDIPDELEARAHVKSGIIKLSPNAAKRMKSPLAGKVHILIVEDNRVNQIVARNLLMEAGFTCDIAADGVEACSAVRNKEYDVVLMDCQMPEMDGFEATKLIRNWECEQGKHRLPIIALTANATKEDVQKCHNAGMDAYSSKPINPATMIRQIEEWYEKGKMEQQQ